jgi:hypothetical protein
MPPALLTYIIARELTGRVTTEEEFRNRLRRFSRNSVVRLSSVLNLVLSNWAGDYDFDAHEKLARSFFPPPIATRIINSKRLAFHRHQLLFVAQQALRHCGDGAREMTPPYWGGFGVVLLMASELLYTPVPHGGTPSEELARKVCQILPDMEVNGIQSYQNKIARSYAMTSRFIEPFRGKANFFDVSKLFENAAGVPLETYQALLFGSVSRFTKLDDLKKSVNPADFAVPEGWFRNTTVSSERIERFFEFVSGSAESFAKAVIEKKPNPNDFTIFRDKPMFQEQGHFYPTDLSFLAEKFESGTFWRVHNSLQPSERANFHSFWGNVFESYITWIMSSSVDGKTNRFCPDPKYAGRPTDQVSDGIVICGRSAVVIEYKSSTFTVAGKYGGDAAKLDSELKSKLVGTDEARKGVHQLADAVQKLCRQKDPDQVEGLDMYGITTVFPLIITRDDLGSAFYMNAYLNWHFQALIKGKRFLRSVTPLFCMSANDLENLSPFLADTSLADILSARYKQDKKLMFSLWTVENAVLQRRGPRKSTLLNHEIEMLGAMIETQLGLKEQ